MLRSMGFLLPQYCTAFDGLFLYIKGTCVDGDFQLFRATLTSKMPLLWYPVLQLDTWLGQITAVRFQIWSITHLVQKDCQGEVWVTQWGTGLSKESATLEVVACFLGQGVTVICTVVRCVLQAEWGQRVTISCFAFWPSNNVYLPVFLSYYSLPFVSVPVCIVCIVSWMTFQCCLQSTASTGGSWK